MAVFVTRALQVMAPVGGFGMVWASDSDAPYSLKVMALANANATEYRLYQSSDGVNFTLATGAVSGGEMGGFEGWSITVPTDTVGLYFKPVAVVNGVERNLAGVLMARPTQVAHSITVLSPTGTGVSLTPTLTWTVPSGAVAFMASIVDPSPSTHDAYDAVVEASCTSLSFGQTSGTGFLGSFASESLQPSSPYWALVRAVDATGWAFATSGDQDFTTGP